MSFRPIDQYNHVILAFITSRTPDRLLESDLVIDSSDRDFFMTGLKVTSTIRLHRLMTVTTSLIKRELGELPSSMQKKIIDKLTQLFGLTQI